MLSIEKCQNVLKSHNYILDNEEVKQLRDFLYQIATYQIEIESENNNSKKVA